MVIYEFKVVDWGMYHQFKGDIAELQETQEYSLVLSCVIIF